MHAQGSYLAVAILTLRFSLMLTIVSACQAILQGHTSLVGQLQMRGDTLVTGGSDGSVRVWSLKKMAPIHRLAAHDNSVTSLQFDGVRVVSGGSDGRVKVWDLKTGALVRELTAPAEAVWRVAFEDEKCVVMASRGNRTVMEVWSFSPPDDFENKDPTPAQRMLEAPYPRPLSCVEYRSARHTDDRATLDHAGYSDIEMTDVGPSTAPSLPVVPTFFHDDDD